MLVKVLHLIFKLALPERQWEAWLVWRAERDRRQAPLLTDRMAEAKFHAMFVPLTAPVTEDTSMPVNLRPTMVGAGEAFIPLGPRRGWKWQPGVHDCGCAVARSASGEHARQFHEGDCEHFSPYAKGGIIQVDRKLIPHRPGRGVCDCYDCNTPEGIVLC